MSKRMLHCFPVAIAIATALALSGCGGGSNTRTDTGTGMPGGGQTLTIPEGLTRSTATPVYATSADSFESAGLETLYPALSVNVTRNWNESTVTLARLPQLTHDFDDFPGFDSRNSLFLLSPIFVTPL